MGIKIVTVLMVDLAVLVAGVRVDLYHVGSIKALA